MKVSLMEAGEVLDSAMIELPERKEFTLYGVPLGVFEAPRFVNTGLKLPEGGQVFIEIERLPYGKGDDDEYRVVREDDVYTIQRRNRRDRAGGSRESGLGPRGGHLGSSRPLSALRKSSGQGRRHYHLRALQEPSGRPHAAEGRGAGAPADV